MNRPQQPLTPEQAEREREADHRDAEAIRRFLVSVYAGGLPTNCSRVGSSQHAAKRRKQAKRQP